MKVARAYAAKGCSGRVPPRRQRAQRGQALLEFTMLFTFLMLLVAGVTDIGSLLDDHVNLVYAARQGARIGSVLGPGPVPNIDCQIVGAIQAALLSQPDVTLTTITIYQAGPAGEITANTLKEVYDGKDSCYFNTTSQGFQFKTPPIVDTWPSWPSTGNVLLRINTPFTEDSIGVRLDYTYQWRFGFFGSGSFSGYDTAVFPLSPSGLPTPVPSGTPAATPTPCINILVCNNGG